MIITKKNTVKKLVYLHTIRSIGSNSIISSLSLNFKAKSIDGNRNPYLESGRIQAAFLDNKLSSSMVDSLILAKNSTIFLKDVYINTDISEKNMELSNIIIKSSVIGRCVFKNIDDVKKSNKLYIELFKAIIEKEKIDYSNFQQEYAKSYIDLLNKLSNSIVDYDEKIKTDIQKKIFGGSIIVAGLAISYMYFKRPVSYTTLETAPSLHSTNFIDENVTSFKFKAENSVLGSCEGEFSKSSIILKLVNSTVKFLASIWS